MQGRIRPISTNDKNSKKSNSVLETSKSWAKKRAKKRVPSSSWSWGWVHKPVLITHWSLRTRTSNQNKTNFYSQNKTILLIGKHKHKHKAKCYCYLALNRQYTVAQYLTMVTDQNLRKTLTKYRLSEHSLAIEKGRHRKTCLPVEERLCNHCTTAEPGSL